MSVEAARQVMLQEAQAIERCAAKLGPEFETAVQWILECKGRTVTCGVGKSGHIARKTAGTLSSTGSPSLFLHASEAVHGDLGMVAPGDVVIFYSQSGETDELVRLFPPIRAIGARSILITGRADSTAALASDLVLSTHVTEEACPLNLAPTTSTTVMLAISDALAVAVMELRGFDKEQFGKLHPSGSLGKRIHLTVADVMRPAAEIAVLSQEATVMDVIQAMTSTAVGAACIVEEGKLTGLISEGDLRRHLLSEHNGLDEKAAAIRNPKPATIPPDLLAVEALEIFENYPVRIGELPVVKDGALVGLLVLKDLLRSGIL